MPQLKGEVELQFIMGGVSAKKRKPYLQVSDGLEGKFMMIGKEAGITPDTFADYSKGDTILCKVTATLSGFVFEGLAE